MGVQKLKSTIPANAKKVFDGVIFDVYQWEQEMFDGSFQTFEKLKRPDTVMCLPITKDKKIILLRQEQPGKPPFVGLAGGRVDEGEDIQEAIKRELLEETGYKAQEFELWLAQQPISKMDWSIYTFIARDCEKVQNQNLDSGEKIEITLVSFDEFVDIALTEEFRDIEVSMEIMRAKINGKLDEIKELFFKGKK